MSDQEKLLDIKGSIKNRGLRFLYSLVAKPLESYLGLPTFEGMYKYVKTHPEHGNFFNRALCAIGFSYEVSSEDIAKVPTTGPLIVVSNHPYGGLDGIAMGVFLLGIRDDAKLLINGLLGKMEEIKPWSISVNPFGGKDAVQENLASMKECIRHLKNGGCISTFPSGTVSHLHLRQGLVTDPEWNSNVAQLARRTGASILPVYFEGGNSWTFHLWGLLHPKLRTLVLMRHMFKAAKKRPIKFHVGKVITPKRIADFESNEELTAWLRLSTYMIGKKKQIPQDNGEDIFKFYSKITNIKQTIMPSKKKVFQEVILPRSPELIQKEIDALPESACLIKGEKICVYSAYAYQIRNTMLEIGRLRELTFREVGEGTGRSVDSDEFDQYYLQIFMWDVTAKRIVGAYRVGRTDKIIPSMGVQGMYSSTLFKMKRELIEKIEPALEMGRSFIVSEYQKKRSTLAILWRGIGEYLARHPHYKTLYGPVSINPEYNSVSKDLMVQFLSQKKTSEELSKYVKAKKPPKVRLSKTDVDVLKNCNDDIDQISALISEIEVDNKGIPTLLKHYLKLNGMIVAFNVDKSFGHCIDGLIVVDMTKTDPRLLKSYMGVQATIDYRKHHGLETPELAEEAAALKKSKEAQPDGDGQ